MNNNFSTAPGSIKILVGGVVVTISAQYQFCNCTSEPVTYETPCCHVVKVVGGPNDGQGGVRGDCLPICDQAGICTPTENEFGWIQSHCGP